MPQFPRALRYLPLLLGLAALPGCDAYSEFAFSSPAMGFLSAPGDVSFDLTLPSGADPGSLVIHLDGQPVPAGSYSTTTLLVHGTLTGLSEGSHWLEAWIDSGDTLYTETGFTLVALGNPDECEILNQVECVLPFPSSRFEEAATTETGVRIAYGANTLPVANKFPDGLEQPITPPVTEPMDPSIFLQNDGFSPTVQVLMHFPQTPDPELSGAARILPATRTYDESGADSQSPTLLIEWDSGRRQIHWIENDGTTSDPARVLTFLRPGRSLQPGKRYIVAVRNLVDASGAAVLPEPVFKAIRDGAPSDLPAVEARRDTLEPVLERLSELGVRREDLILAFDFQVQSDHSLTHEMLSMRDQAFAWLAAQRAAGTQTFTVDEVEEVNPDCTDPDEPVWKIVKGSYQVPLFLDKDLFGTDAGGQSLAPALSNLLRDAQGLPIWNTLTNAPYGIGIPCAVFDDPQGFASLPPLVIGHGLFGTGPGTIGSVAGSPLVPAMISGATNWSGLSSPDTGPSLLSSFVVRVTSNPDKIEALADRLRQGQTNTLVLARMLHGGDFNMDPEFQGPGGQGVILPDGEIYYWGASLGGIMGTLFAALTPDVERLIVDVPAINFSLLLHRATPFLTFEGLLNFVTPERMTQAIGIGLSHEIWVRGEPAGYATHVTDDPLPGVPFAKRVLVHVALHDQQVSNLGSQLLGATLRVPVQEGSTMQDLAGMESSTGPQDSAYVVYDTAAFDLSNPAHLPFVPPLYNEQAMRNHCDPHGRQAIIPAALEQLAAFFQPTGQVENFCTDDGLCNASTDNEFPDGVAVPCDPLN
ncbi:MAG: hypothetical protein CL910_18655 [Deltaproteobacteria bacterium]|nr:hypothetical protein [Deltaproteobacteria bacterium]